MPLIVRTHNYVAGAIIVASQNNTNETTLYNVINGNLDADNISSLAESAITFSTSTGHDHDGSNSQRIDISGAGFLLRCATTGTNHAIIGTSTSSSAHAGLSGTSSTSNGLGGFFDHTNSSGNALLVEASGGGNPALVRNANGVAGDSALKVAHRSTTAAKAGIEITEVASGGYGILIDDPTGDGIRVLGGPNTGTGIYVEDDGTLAGTYTPAWFNKSASGGSGPTLLVSSDSSSTASTSGAIRVSARQRGLVVQNDVNAETGVMIAEFSTSSSSVDVTPAANGWFYIDGTDVDNSTTLPVFKIEGKANQAGVLAYLVQDNNTADGPAGGSSASAWVLKCENSGGGTNDNCAWFGGYVRIDGSLLSTGGTKSFMNPHPNDRSKGIKYVCLEGPENGIYWRGSGKVGDDGYASISIPDYVTLALESGEEMMVVVSAKRRLCQICAWHEVEEEVVYVQSDLPNVEFSFVCFGTRRYFKDHEVIVDMDWNAQRTVPTNAAAKAYGVLK